MSDDGYIGPTDQEAKREVLAEAIARIQKMSDDAEAGILSVKLERLGPGHEAEVIQLPGGGESRSLSDEDEEKFDNEAKAEDWEAIDGYRGEMEAYSAVLDVLQLLAHGITPAQGEESDEAPPCGSCEAQVGHKLGCSVDITHDGVNPPVYTVPEGVTLTVTDWGDSGHTVVVTGPHTGTLPGPDTEDDGDGFFDPESLTKLDGESLDQLSSRVSRGRECLEIVNPDEEPETAASDAISDILTAVFGPAGTYSRREDGGTRCNVNSQTILNAAALLDRAMDSWRGDAEDYTEEG